MDSSSDANLDDVAVTLESDDTSRMRTYCASEHCASVWFQAPMPTNAAVYYQHDYKVYDYLQLILHLFDPKPMHFCAKCHETLSPKEKAQCSGHDGSWTIFGTSRVEKYDLYVSFVALSRRFAMPLLVSLVGFPLVALLQALRCPLPARITELYAHLPRFHAFLSWAYLWATYASIVFSLPFTAQVLFWGLLELYTVFLLVVGLAFATTLKQRGRYTARYQLFFALQAIVFPSACLLLPLNLILSIPNTHLLGLTTDLRTLELVDDHERPLEPSFLPKHFASTRLARSIRSTLVKWAIRLVVLVNCTMGLNLLLMLSWTTWVLPTTPILLPGFNTLVNSPDNVLYSVKGHVTSSCTPGAMSQSVQGIWSFLLEPTPTTARGLPTLVLGFRTETNEPATFRLENAASLDVRGQESTSFSFVAKHGQAAFSFLGTFYNTTCGDVQALTPRLETVYADISLQHYLDLVHGARVVAPIPAFLLTKFLFQMCFIPQCVGTCTLVIWTLWRQFDALTPRISLTRGRNVLAWFRLRCAVVATVKLYATFVQVLVSLAMIQFVVAVGGLAVYCLTGTAPMPTYYLLMAALAGSLSILLYLFPLSSVVSLQANHADTLRMHLLQLQDARFLAEADEGRRIEYFKALIDKIDHHDDYIRYWGKRLSPDQLLGLSVTLASGISFVVTKSVQFSWSTLNPWYISY
ncbi:hypothetical protein SDRG_01152 [Saprolegnia diclina VS20]|uniref:Transmembrane protein n=1 Tax=Saprolegnia diclina (strain VS20) TaxID=1156394 RepID=T0R2I8_SAPDV|nr:hypothetical protein SDRG_01152 [Saprolegnia diclina VS20]EQC41176.1 hypothetical protein SDRG_01152 [Saprolegnia diclina VS20]|eukprot:XP_008604890.1 hypothetical protein SDRG_01152 [Saprolegnia diclina VS20]